MPGKDLVTESCVRRMAPGSVLRLSPEKIATPAALDLAHERGIRVQWGEESGPAAGAAARGAAELWQRMLAEDGTYVVVVKGGRASVNRLDEAGPTPFGQA